MSFLEYLRANRQPAEDYLDFVKSYKDGERIVYAFFEGPGDFSFYTQFLEAFLPEEYTIKKFSCGDKSKVYEVHAKTLMRKVNNSRLLFFVDKDLSDILGKNYPIASNIYVTDYYSVENFVVTPSVVKKVCEEIYHINNVDECLEMITNKFEQELKKFYKFILPIMSWI